jgi:hypothetical protein
MLTCAESRCQVSGLSQSGATQFLNVLQAVDEFVCELRLRETNPEKRHKIAALALDKEEWMRVRLFSNILQVHLCIPVSNTNLT